MTIKHALLKNSKAFSYYRL